MKVRILYWGNAIHLCMAAYFLNEYFNFRIIQPDSVFLLHMMIVSEWYRLTSVVYRPTMCLHWLFGL